MKRYKLFSLIFITCLISACTIEEGYSIIDCNENHMCTDGWAEAKCSDNHDNQCIATGCKDGYKLSEGECQRIESIEKCGNENINCTEQTGWLEGTCTDGKCIATGCKDGYELSDGKCEAPFKCEDEQHSYRNKCEDDSIEHCGEHGYNCVEQMKGWNTGICKNKQCVAITCLDDYELDTSGKCVKKLCINGYAEVEHEGKTIKAKCISSEKEFEDFRTHINNGSWPDAENVDNAYILTKDLEFGEVTETVGVDNTDIWQEDAGDYYFKGIFLGGGHKIKYIHNQSIFGYTSNAWIEGLNLELLDVIDNDSCGFVRFIYNTTIKDCTLRTLFADISKQSASLNGGFSGHTNSKSSLINCSIYGPLSLNSETIGAFSDSISDSTVDNCYVDNKVIIDAVYSSGLVGYVSSGTIRNSLSEATVNNISRCDYEKSYIDKRYAGGLVSNAAGTVVIENSAFKGVITNNCHNAVTGGIIAGNGDSDCKKSMNLTIHDSAFLGKINSTHSSAAGIIGNLCHSNSSAELKNVAILGKVNAPESDASGLINLKDAKATINKAYFLGSITGKNVNYSLKNESGTVTSNNIFISDNQKTDSSVTISNYTAMVDGSPLISKLGSGWKTYQCKFESNEFGFDAGTYNIPLPEALKAPSSCTVLE